MPDRCITNRAVGAQITLFLIFFFSGPSPFVASAFCEPVSPDPQLIDLNHASLDELVSLPGIGPKTAQRIVRYRQRRPFVSVRQLRRIRGIGRKKYLRLRHLVRVGRERTPKDESASLHRDCSTMRAPRQASNHESALPVSGQALPDLLGSSQSARLCRGQHAPDPLFVIPNGRGPDSSRHRCHTGAPSRPAPTRLHSDRLFPVSRTTNPNFSTRGHFVDL